MKVTTTELFIEKAKKVHGSKFNYSKSSFINSKTKTVITCPAHGDFWQTPNNHLTGFGCTKCGRAVSTAKQAYSTADFIAKANTVHSNLYDYSKTKYVNSKTNVIITCPVHGDFSMIPGNHTHKTVPQGCPTCGMEKRAQASRLSFTDFVTRASTKHGNKYTYNFTTYGTYHDKTEIYCSAHGSFFQTPAHHLNGTGCPSCAKTGFDTSKPAILYYLSINDGQAYKVGITNRSVNERFTVKDLKSIVVLDTLSFPNGRDAYLMEQKILKHYHNHKYTGTNLLESGNTELLTINIIEESSLDHISQTLKDL